MSNSYPTPALPLQRGGGIFLGKPSLYMWRGSFFMFKKVLILGVGNDILTDDGIGPKLVWFLKEDAKKRRNEKTSLEFQTAALGGLELLELIQGYEHVIFIDAIKTKNGVPGTVYEFTPEDFKETHHLSHMLDVSFLQALKLGQQLKISIPKRINIIAIEIVEDLVFSNEFSPQIQEKWDEIKIQVEKILKRLSVIPQIASSVGA